MQKENGLLAGDTEEILDSTNDEPICEGDWGGDDRFLHRVFRQEFETIFDIGNKHDAIFAGSIKSSPGNQGRTIKIRPVLGERIRPNRFARGRIQAMNVPLVSQNVDFAFVGHWRWNECAYIGSQ